MTRDWPGACADDGLLMQPVGLWAERKYRLVTMYAHMFAKSMKGRWHCRVCIDLFAGPGKSIVKETGRIVRGSPLLTLETDDPYDRYIFCEKDSERLAALKRRVENEYPNADVQYVHGDSNEAVNDILSLIPPHSPGKGVLSFCFADPYRMSNLAFSTIRSLSSRRMDFLVLIPSWMDANRNLPRYLNPENTKVADFLGDPKWRQAWREASASRTSFDVFLVNRYAAQMEALGYKDPGIGNTQLIRSIPKNLPLYRLGLFSRHDLGAKFWRQARKYSTPQLDLLGD